MVIAMGLMSTRINKPIGCLITRVPFKYQIISIWRAPQTWVDIIHSMNIHKWGDLLTYNWQG